MGEAALVLEQFRAPFRSLSLYDAIVRQGNAVVVADGQMLTGEIVQANGIPAGGNQGNNGKETVPGYAGLSTQF